MKNYLIVIVGPTAIGKTALSIKIAKHFNTEIISCDSRQFYKEMTIGTAVPSTEELMAVHHHFIQNKSIFDNYTVGDYENEVLPIIDQLFQKNNIQVVVGGSGLYVDAILKGFDEFPEVSEEIKQQIEYEYNKDGISYLQNQLKHLDPSYTEFLQNTNPQTLVNPQRMKRFVGVCLASNKPYSSFLNQKKANRNFTPVLIGLNADRNIMYQRINNRVDLMMQNGLLKEINDLYPHKHLNALQTVGYRELFDYIDEKLTLEQAVEEIKKNTRRFSKRQLTWFQRYEAVEWFDFNTPVQSIIAKISTKINDE